MVTPKAVQQASKSFKEMGILDSKQTQQSLKEMVCALECLPINTDCNTFGRIAGFILVGFEWFPVNVMNYLRDGWIEYSIRYAEGGSENGIAHLGTWADATMDDTPNMPEAFWTSIGLREDTMQT